MSCATGKVCEFIILWDLYASGASRVPCFDLRVLDDHTLLMYSTDVHDTLNENQKCGCQTHARSWILNHISTDISSSCPFCISQWTICTTSNHHLQHIVNIYISAPNVGLWSTQRFEVQRLEQSLNLTSHCVKVDQITGSSWVSEKAGKYAHGCEWIMAHSSWKYLVHHKELQKLYIWFLWVTFSSHKQDIICTGQGFRHWRGQTTRVYESRRLKI